jgi:hypothetical protein
MFVVAPLWDDFDDESYLQYLRDVLNNARSGEMLAEV